MNPKFLIVDDDPSCTDLLATMLQSMGCDAKTLHSGTEALALLSDKTKVDQFDAVFLDIMMPDVDGLEVLRQFRAMAHGADLPVLLLTALDKSEHVMHGYSHGATYYITKPFSQEQIVYGLDMILGTGSEEEKQERVFRLDD